MPDELGFSFHDLYIITCIDHNSYNSEFYYDYLLLLLIILFNFMYIYMWL